MQYKNSLKNILKNKKGYMIHSAIMICKIYMT